jgi:hypothetical protein
LLIVDFRLLTKKRKFAAFQSTINNQQSKIKNQQSKMSLNANSFCRGGTHVSSMHNRRGARGGERAFNRRDRRPGAESGAR